MYVLNQDSYAVFGMAFVRQIPRTAEMISLNYDMFMESPNGGILNILVVRRICVGCGENVKYVPMATSFKS